LAKTPAAVVAGAEAAEMFSQVSPPSPPAVLAAVAPAPKAPTDTLTEVDAANVKSALVILE
jgi:hypothetical protein